MSKIRDWLIRCLGGVTEEEFWTVMNANAILAQAFKKERTAKQHVIEQARSWKKRWNDANKHEK